MSLFKQLYLLAVWYYDSADFAAQNLVKAAGVPEPTIQERVQHVIEGWEPTVVASYLAITIVGFLLCVMVLKKSRYLVMKAQGIHFEAMVPGSEFQKGGIPNCQVEILSYGLLVKEFVGYGIRVGEMLVLPNHVYQTVKNKGDVLLQGTDPQGKKKIVSISVEPFKSKIHPDVAYIPLTSQTWALLGTSKAKLATTMRRGLVQCAGRNGVVLGNICESPQSLGMVIFGGSTVPGMSGAAYMVSNNVHGMHIGHIGMHNTGVSSLLIAAEMEKLFVGESSGGWIPSDHPDYDERMNAKRAREAELDEQVWNKKDIASLISHAYEGRLDGRKSRKNQFGVDSSWADNYQSSWADLADEELEALHSGEAIVQKILHQIHALPPNTMRGLINSLTTIENCPVQQKFAVGQSNEEVPNVAIPPSANEVFKKITQERLIVLSDRVAKLENRVEELSRVKPAQGPVRNYEFRCPLGCVRTGSKAPRAFATSLAAHAHHVVVHHSKGFDINAYKKRAQEVSVGLRVEEKTVVGESAVSGDNVTKEDLGFQKKQKPSIQSRQKSIQTSKNTSSLSDTSGPSIVTQVNQPNIQDLVTQLEKLCGMLRPVTSGQSLDMQQK